MNLTTHTRFDLARLGWDETWAEAMELHGAAGFVPGRVSAQLRGAYTVLTEFGQIRTELAGRLRHESTASGSVPAVGDWVAVAVGSAEGESLIHAVLPRRTAITRKAAGRATTAQVLAANVDLVAVVSPLDGDGRARRLERYLSAAWESGARPIVVLTKSDLRADAEAVAADVAASAFVSAHAVSALTGAGLEALRMELRGAGTLALVGPSGAGKSTLVNSLLGEERQITHELRRDGKGRHTTTQRELFLLPEGGVIVDTPGLRELGLWGADAAGTDETFADVLDLAGRCRFTDCAHETEPGCAVRAAVDDGRLDSTRLESWRKLERELAWMERRRDGRAIAEQRRARRRMAKSFRRVSEGPWTS